jgi:Predicted SPOUT methyltransferase
MTFSHELARILLAEQLYRGFAMLSGSAYPKQLGLQPTGLAFRDSRGESASLR